MNFAEIEEQEKPLQGLYFEDLQRFYTFSTVKDGIKALPQPKEPFRYEGEFFISAPLSLSKILAFM